MKRILSVLAAIGILTVGGFAMVPSAQADDQPGGPACGTRNC